MPFDYDTDKPSMAASVQAGALEELGKESSIQSLHRGLASSGASAAQPKKKKVMSEVSTKLDKDFDEFYGVGEWSEDTPPKF